MKNVMARITMTALATGIAALATTTTARDAHAEWTATDTEWNGCAQTTADHRQTVAAQTWLGIAVGCSAPDAAGDYALIAYRRKVSSDIDWQPAPGRGVGVSMSPEGTYWRNDNAGNVFYFDLYNGAVWKQIPGCARSIAAAANGRLWAIGCTPQNGYGNDIESWDGTAWTQQPGAATQIAVSPEGRPWVLTSNGGIFRWDGAYFRWVRGCARAISVGPNDGAWVIGCEDQPDGGGAYRYENGDFKLYPGRHGVAIDAFADGWPWIVDVSGKMYSYEPATISISPQATGYVNVLGEGWGQKAVTLDVIENNVSQGEYNIGPRIDGVIQTFDTDLNILCAHQSRSGTIIAHDGISTAYATYTCTP